MGFFDKLFASRSGKSPERTLKLMGDESARAKGERILARFSSAVRLQANRKLDQCFADHKLHSVAWSIGDVFVVVYVHPGNYQDVAPSLQGQYTARYSQLISPDNYAALLMLDYFVHDPRNSASPIDLAVSLLHGGKEAQLPEEMTSGLLHLEMLSEAEREMFSGKKKETVSDQPRPERGPQEEEASKMSAIGIRFDIDKLTDRSNSYGLEAWKVFWRAVQPSDVNGVSFRAGDEFGYSVYTIAVSLHDKNGATVQKICSSLAASSDFDLLCAYPQFLEGEARCTAQPLVAYGKMVGTEVDCTDAQSDARWALETVRKERQATS
jgi:hypothetical protein